MGGAATLIVTPERESVLIDSGWPGLEDRDPKRIVHVLKDVAGLDHLDHLVTTHWHMDHFGGVEGLSKRVRIGHFWDRGCPTRTPPTATGPTSPTARRPTTRSGSPTARRARASGTVLKAGDTLPLRATSRRVVLASGGKVIDGAAAPATRSARRPRPTSPRTRADNARSLALRFRLGKFDFLDCGDLTWNVEKQLVCPVDRIGPIDLFQVTHHGMDISNHPTLLRTIEPTVAVMDNGPSKGGRRRRSKLLKSMPSIQAAYQLHKNAATGPDENTDPALIANRDPEAASSSGRGRRRMGRNNVRIGAGRGEKEFSTK